MFSEIEVAVVGDSPFIHLMEVADNVRCVVKDRKHRYCYVNRTWREGFGYSGSGVQQVIGKTAWDLFPKWRASRYIEEEQKVMEELRVFDYEEYILNADGLLETWRTVKSPWMKNGECCGYTNIGTRLGVVLEQRRDQLPKVIEVVVRRACSRDSIDTIASSLGMSRRTLERRFKEMMNETPQQFRLRCKIAQARKYLKQGKKIIDVAEECGFSDQSHFSKVFSKLVGRSPKRFQLGR